MVSFKVKGLEELEGRFEELGTKGKISLNEMLRKIGKLFVPHKGTGPLANETPVVSGKLKRSTIFQIIGGGEKQALEIRQGARSKGGAFYGHWVREGADPHIILPKRAKFLRFEIGGRVVFARKVHHPATSLTGTTRGYLINSRMMSRISLIALAGQ